jgi:hypothetical protein
MAGRRRPWVSGVVVSPQLPARAPVAVRLRRSAAAAAASRAATVTSRFRRRRPVSAATAAAAAVAVLAELAGTTRITPLGDEATSTGVETDGAPRSVAHTPADFVVMHQRLQHADRGHPSQLSAAATNRPAGLPLDAPRPHRPALLCSRSMFQQPTAPYGATQGATTLGDPTFHRGTSISIRYSSAIEEFPDPATECAAHMPRIMALLRWAAAMLATRSSAYGWA